MFEKTILNTGKAIYWLTVSVGAIWLTSVCLMHLPFWATLMLLPLLLALAAAVGAPVVAAVSLCVGLLVAMAVFIAGKASRSDA